jgi:hypothetical protein
MKKLLLLTLASLVAIALLPMTAALAEGPSDETAFVGGINALRASKGLPALSVHPNLTSKARAWAQTMADKDTIWHSVLSDGITADWQKIGENVGRGGTVAGLELAFANSPLHYANLIDPTFNTIGLGVVRGAGDVIFVAEEFMQLRTSIVAPTAPAVVQAPVAPKIAAAVAPVAVKSPVTPQVTAPVGTPPAVPMAVEALVAVKAPATLREGTSVPSEVSDTARRIAPLGGMIAAL